MKRREFLKAAGVGVAASTVAAPAIAQSMPEIKWRLTASWPKSLDTLYGAAKYFAKRIAEITDNKFQIQVFAAGEIVPGLQVLDAVQNGTVEMGHTATYYYFGKDPAFTFGTALPFGLNTPAAGAPGCFRAAAWSCSTTSRRTTTVSALPPATPARQMGGWFRKEIKSVDDLKGLKMRIGGFAGAILAKLGVVPQQLAGGDIYPALEKGTIDAAEWVGPYDDEKLGFLQGREVLLLSRLVGRRRPAAQLHQSRQVERAAEELPGDRASLRARGGRLDDAQIRRAAIRRRSSAWWPAAPSCARSRRRSWRPATRRPTRSTPRCRRATRTSRSCYDSLAAFRGDSYQWRQVAELGFDSFMMRMRTRA